MSIFVAQTLKVKVMAKKSISKVKEDDVLMLISSSNVRWAVAGKCGCGYKLTPLNRSGYAVSFASWSVIDYLKSSGYDGLAETVKSISQLYRTHRWSRLTFYAALYELLANSFGFVASSNSRLVIDVTQNFHYYKVF